MPNTSILAANVIHINPNFIDLSRTELKSPKNIALWEALKEHAINSPLANLSEKISEYDKYRFAIDNIPFASAIASVLAYGPIAGFAGPLAPLIPAIAWGGGLAVQSLSNGIVNSWQKYDINVALKNFSETLPKYTTEKERENIFTKLLNKAPDEIKLFLLINKESILNIAPKLTKDQLKELQENNLSYLNQFPHLKDEVEKIEKTASHLGAEVPPVYHITNETRQINQTIINSYTQITNYLDAKISGLDDRNNSFIQEVIDAAKNNPEIEKIKQRLDDIGNNVKKILDMNEETQKQLQNEAEFKALISTSQALSALGAFTQNKDLIKIGGICEASLHFAKNVDKLAGLIINPSATALMCAEPISGLILATIHLINIMKPSGESFESAVMKNLTVLSKQIECLHTSMIKNFEIVNKKLDHIELLIITSSNRILKSLSHLDKKLGYIGYKIDQLRLDIAFLEKTLESAIAQQFASNYGKLLDNIHLAERDSSSSLYETMSRDKYQMIRPNLVHLIRSVATSSYYIGDRNLGYNPEIVLKEFNERTSPFNRIGYLRDYASLHLSIDDLKDTKNKIIASPSLYLHGVECLTLFIKRCLDNGYDFALGDLKELSEIKKIGDDTITFLEKVCSSIKLYSKLFKDFEQAQQNCTDYIFNILKTTINHQAPFNKLIEHGFCVTKNLDAVIENNKLMSNIKNWLREKYSHEAAIFKLDDNFFDQLRDIKDPIWVRELDVKKSIRTYDIKQIEYERKQIIQPIITNNFSYNPLCALALILELGEVKYRYSFAVTEINAGMSRHEVLSSITFYVDLKFKSGKNIKLQEIKIFFDTNPFERNGQYTIYRPNHPIPSVENYDVNEEIKNEIKTYLSATLEKSLEVFDNVEFNQYLTNVDAKFLILFVYTNLFKSDDDLLNGINLRLSQTIKDDLKLLKGQTYLSREFISKNITEDIGRNYYTEQKEKILSIINNYNSTKDASNENSCIRFSTTHDVVLLLKNSIENIDSLIFYINEYNKTVSIINNIKNNNLVNIIYLLNQNPQLLNFKALNTTPVAFAIEKNKNRILYELLKFSKQHSLIISNEIEINYLASIANNYFTKFLVTNKDNILRLTDNQEWDYIYQIVTLCADNDINSINTLLSATNNPYIDAIIKYHSIWYLIFEIAGTNIVDCLLQHLPDTEEFLYQHPEFIYDLIKNNKEQLAELLIKYGADLFLPYQYREEALATPLGLALLTNQATLRRSFLLGQMPQLQINKIFKSKKLESQHLVYNESTFSDCDPEIFSLIRAIRLRDYSRAEYILSNNLAYFSVTNPVGDNLLMITIESIDNDPSHLFFTKLMNHISIMSRGELGWNSIFVASREEKFLLLDKLLSSINNLETLKNSVQELDGRGKTALTAAIYYNNVQSARVLIEAGIMDGICSQLRNTYLTQAINKPELQSLLQNSERLYFQGKLFWSISRGHDLLMQDILSNHTDKIDLQKTSIHGDSLLTLAAIQPKSDNHSITLLKRFLELLGSELKFNSLLVRQFLISHVESTFVKLLNSNVENKIEVITELSKFVKQFDLDHLLLCVQPILTNYYYHASLAITRATDEQANSILLSVNNLSNLTIQANGQAEQVSSINNRIENLLLVRAQALQQCLQIIIEANIDNSERRCSRSP